MLSGLLFFFGKEFYQHFLRGKIDLFILKSLHLDVVMLCYFMIYVFVICGLILIMIGYWLGWENVRFKLKQMRYRSAMIARDYYRDRRRINYDRVVGGLDRFGDGKLDLTGQDGGDVLAGQIEDTTTTASGSIAFKHGKLDGLFQSHYENGQIESEVSYRDGRLDGGFRTFYGDGKLHTEKFYRDGKLDGIFKAYDEDGSLFFEIQYRDGKQDGFDKIYYRNGALEYLDTYKDGKRIRRKTYDEGGNLKFEQEFD